MSDLVGHPYRFSSDAPRTPQAIRTARPEPPPDPPERDPRPLFRKKRFLIPTGLLLIALGVLAATTYAVKKAEERARIVAAERERFAQFLETREAPFLRVPLLTAREAQLLRRSTNPTHLEYGQRLGVEPVSGRDELDSLFEAHDLTRIDANDYYWVARLTHSVPFLTGDAAAVLDSIGLRFHRKLTERGLPPYRFNVSSVLRTGEDQARLRRVNVNAAVGTSSHELGTTFDIQFRRYRYAGDARAEVSSALGPLPFGFLYDEFARELEAFYDEAAASYASRLQALLGRALIELEDEGLLVTIMERRQPVYHTTVAERLAGDGASASAAEP